MRESTGRLPAEGAPPAATPTVTVITPSYNQARYLRATLESVASQDYPRIQHIVMDGGSTDETVDLLKSWAREHDIEWTSGPDDGQAVAISAGIERARGEIVTWLNSDDVYLDSGAISAAVDGLASGGSVVTGGGWYLSESGERLSRIPVQKDRLRFRSLRHVDWILQPATFFRRETLAAYPLDTALTYAFDWDLFIRLARDVGIKPIARDLAGYRVHAAAKTVSGASARKRELLTVTRRYNAPTSPHYLLLRSLVTGYELVERLPRPLDRARSLFTGIALLSHRLPGGRGVQF